MNKYIDHLTLNEYKVILESLNDSIKLEHKKLDENGQNKKYVELRFIALKVKQIIKKYEKRLDK